VTPLGEYQNRLADRRAVSERHSRLFRWIGNARLLSALAGLILAFFVFGETVVSPWWLLAPAVLFTALVVIHARVVERLERANRAVAFYERGVARIESQWAGSGEPGERFRNPAHVYAEDLDLFGKGSLFELLCTARTRAGEDTLARWLLGPASAEEVAARHQAIDELRPRLDLREDLAVLGDTIRARVDSEVAARWGKAPPVSFPVGARILAALLASAVVVTFGLYMGGWLSRTPVLIALLVELGYGFYLGSRTLQVTRAVDSPARDLGLLARLLERLEREPFEASLLRRMQAALAPSGLVASAEIGRLRRLVHMMDWQRNIVFAPIAIALLWSVQIAMAIERWRRRAGPHIGTWIAEMGEFEALLALAGYSYEHPSDPLPELVDSMEGYFEADGIAHPLMPEAQAIRNDVRVGGDVRLLIVSGSNMSGKSTLLRAIGLNAVLAWAGAPVRATSLRISPLRVGASIRLLDSLQDGRSRFYAEITRLREIAELAQHRPAVLFLIDELLSGTNSHDRKIGAGAIVRTLVDRGAIGLITTHDLALTGIAAELSGRATNIHFEDTLSNGTLHFDYRLRQGVVERSNALDLMRSVGLEV
jgi:MutS-like protein